MRAHPAAGVLLANLGTPDAPTTPAVKRYLKEFLSDPRVVDLPKWKWWPILEFVILPRRSPKSAAAYREVWTDEGSPLLATGRRQAAKLEAAAGVPVALGMRYGNPSLGSALDELKRKGCSRVLLLPLYPQYAGATVGSTIDALAASLKRTRVVPEVRTINSYHEEPLYVEALRNSVRGLWDAEGEPARLLMSFHGLPQRYSDAGDPYVDQCQETARLLADALGLADERWLVAFQSRFGREEWVQPYTDATLEAWGKEKLESADVICPGFAADCLETIQEIGVENRECFTESGGGRYRYIEALNDRDDHIAALADLVARNLQGWCS